MLSNENPTNRYLWCEKNKWWVDLNLLHSKLASQRLIRWRMLLEEFAPEVSHVEGEKNIAADALSRLEMEAKEEDLILSEESEERLQCACATTKDIKEEKFPMSPKLISKKQKGDKFSCRIPKNT